jgi:hypothetical protein
METKQIIDELEADRDRLDAAIAALQDGAKKRKRLPPFQQRPGSKSVMLRKRDGPHGRGTTRPALNS